MKKHSLDHKREFRIDIYKIGSSLIGANHRSFNKTSRISYQASDTEVADHRLEEQARKLGIICRDVNFNPHLFRRICATTLYRSGRGLKAIQAKIHHVTIETLTRHYIHDDEKACPYLAKMLT